MFHYSNSLRAKNKPKGTKQQIYAYKKKMRILSTTVTFVIIFSLIAIISYSIIKYYSGSETPNGGINGNSGNHSLKAALIDGLYINHPNENFTKALNQTLQEAGFEVDIYQGTEVTVDFLKKLSNDYKLVILRMHSALSSNNQLYFFTAEPYSVGKYTQEQYFLLVKEAYATDNSPPVFAVNWAFIKQCMTEKFNGTLVVAMGCDGTLDSFMINEFMNQGALGYISWTGPITLSHSDKAILYLVQVLYWEKLPIEQAVEKTNNQMGADPNLDTILECHIP